MSRYGEREGERDVGRDSGTISKRESDWQEKEQAEQNEGRGITR